MYRIMGYSLNRVRNEDEFHLVKNRKYSLPFYSMLSIFIFLFVLFGSKKPAEEAIREYDFISDLLSEVGS